MGYKIDEELIEKIKDTINIVDVVSRYVSLKKTGSNYVGLCPFHNEKTPSFTVSESKNLFHCFGCGEGGDLISFIMKREGLTFVESVKFLADMYGIPIETTDNDQAIEVKKEKEQIYKINKEAALFYFNNLRGSPRAINYLTKRNINKDIIIKYGLGYALNSWNGVYEYLISKGFKDKDIEKAGLINRKKGNTGYYDKFRNRVIFPIIDVKNRIIGFGGRVLDDKKPKYLNSPDTLVFEKGKNLYGLNLVNKESNREKIILVEGYMDVISLYSHGINYAVASLGTALTKYQAKLLKRFGQKIYICYDSDDAGIKAALKAINILEKEEIEPRIIILPKGLDPDDFIKRKGLEEFKKLEDVALNHVDYRIFILKGKYNLNDSEEKIKFTKEVAKIIRSLKSPIEREVYIDKISKETNISREAIGKEISGNAYRNSITIHKDKYINRENRYNKKEILPITTVLEAAYLTAEKNLINLMIKSRNYFNKVEKRLSVEDFLNGEYKILLNAIYDEYYKNSNLKEIDIDLLLNKFGNSKDIDYQTIKEIIKKDIVADNMEKLIEESINTINYYKLKNERELVARRIKEITLKKDKGKGDVEEFRKLCIKLTELDREIKLHL